MTDNNTIATPKKRTTRKKGNPLKNKSEWTIPELQMWVSSAFALQGDDWVPNTEQWDMLVDIIFKLKDRQLVRKEESHTSVPHIPVMGRVLPQPNQMTELNNGGDGVNPSFDPNIEFPPLPPEANLSVAELDRLNRAGGLNRTGVANTVKTPNIDTSKGYNSGFA